MFICWSLIFRAVYQRPRQPSSRSREVQSSHEGQPSRRRNMESEWSTSRGNEFPRCAYATTRLLSRATESRTRVVQETRFRCPGRFSGSTGPRTGYVFFPGLLRKPLRRVYTYRTKRFWPNHIERFALVQLFTAKLRVRRTFFYASRCVNNYSDEKNTAQKKNLICVLTLSIELLLEKWPTW